MSYFDTNNLRIVTGNHSNTLEAVSMADDCLRLSGMSGEWPGQSQVVLVDSGKRFIASGSVHADKHWDIVVHPATLPKDKGILDCLLYVARSGDNRVVRIHGTPEQVQVLTSFMEGLLPSDAQALPSFSDQYVDLIVTATRERYVSTSVFEGIKTGNNYQSIDFGAILREGGRPLRSVFMEKVKFSGAEVLDIGANTGEVSRYVRRLGARLVDGYEYDPFFLETGRAVNAVLGTTRVSLFQGDATQPEFYAGMKYDVIVALSVYVYLADRLADLVRVAPLLVFETHTLDHGVSFYLDRLRPHFPHVRHLGHSENNRDPRRSRAFLVFSTSERVLADRVPEDRLRLEPYFNNTFLTKHRRIGRSEFHAFCAEMESLWRSCGSSVNSANRFGSEDYFAVLLAGFSEYLRSGRIVTKDNAFLRSYRESIESNSLDPGLRYLLDDDGMIATKVRNKFFDIECLASGEPYLIPPVTIVPSDGGSLRFTSVDGTQYECEMFDGHHRFFAAQLLGYSDIRFEVSEGGPARTWTRSIAPNYTLDL